MSGTIHTGTLPTRTLEEIVEVFPAYRQSLLGEVDNCALSALFDLQGYPYTTAEQARGIIFHRFAAEMLRTLSASGETQMPHEEVMRILYEASAQRDVPPQARVVVPARQRRMLLIAALALADIRLDMSRLISVEERLFTTVRYDGPDGPVERLISGQADALLADPPNGGGCLDWKTAPSAPAKGEQPHWTGDHLHVSYEGYWQQRFYALLIMDNYPMMDYVKFREYYPIPRESREALIPREALEHIRQEITLVVEFLDRALMGGSEAGEWRPSPGKHCAWCRRPQDCPIERSARATRGGVTDADQAAKIGAETVLAKTVYDEGREAMKAWYDATGEAIPVKDAKGRFEWRWSKDSSGRRKFGMFVPEVSDRGPGDEMLAQAFAEAKGDA
jgi:hypothetical protein